MIDRRRWLVGASLAALVAQTAQAQAQGRSPARAPAQPPAPAAPPPEPPPVLLLSGGDHRTATAVGKFMESRGLAGKYIQVALQGGAVAALADRYHISRNAFWEQLELALDLHKITKLLVLDQRDCPIYRVVFGAEFSQDRGIETVIHSDQQQKLANEVTKRFPQIQVELLLMNLDGTVDALG